MMGLTPESMEIFKHSLEMVRKNTKEALGRRGDSPIPSILDVLAHDSVCIAGHPERCTYDVSPVDPDKELCPEHLIGHIHQLEMDLDDALKELLRYREAGKES